MSQKSGIEITFDSVKATAQLRDYADRAETSTKRFLSDVKGSGRAWVNKGIAAEYHISTAKVKSHTSFYRVKGGSLGEVTLIFKGSRISPASFSMKPKSPKKEYDLVFSIPNGKEYTVGRVKKITKKQRANIDRNFTKQGVQHSEYSPIMLMGTGAKSSSKTQHIPFQRKGKGRGRKGEGGRLASIKAPSVPQMIRGGDGDLKKGVELSLNENVQKRFDHHFSWMDK